MFGGEAVGSVFDMCLLYNLDYIGRACILLDMQVLKCSGSRPDMR